VGNDGVMVEANFPSRPWNEYTQVWLLSGSNQDKTDVPTDHEFFRVIRLCFRGAQPSYAQDAPTGAFPYALSRPLSRYSWGLRAEAGGSGGCCGERGRERALSCRDVTVQPAIISKAVKKVLQQLRPQDDDPAVRRQVLQKDLAKVEAALDRLAHAVAEGGLSASRHEPAIHSFASCATVIKPSRSLRPNEVPLHQAPE